MTPITDEMNMASVESEPEASELVESADVTALDALPDASFDTIVSFETLEHVEAQERMLAGFARLLAPGVGQFDPVQRGGLELQMAQDRVGGGVRGRHGEECNVRSRGPALQEFAVES